MNETILELKTIHAELVAVEMAKMFIEKGADIDMQDFNGETILVHSIRNKRNKLVAMLIEKGANLNLHYKFRLETALIIAVLAENDIAAKLLIENGIGIDLQDETGSTPLIYAIYKKNETIAKLLIEKGANIDIQSYDGETALITAINNDYNEMAKLLIEKGANINARTERHYTALICACKWREDELVELLIEKGVNLDEQTLNVDDNYKRHNTALMYAIEGKRYRIIKLLIKKGTDVNLVDSYGKPALMYAIKRKMYKVVGMLIEKGAYLNLQDKKGNTILMQTLEDKNYEMAEFLIMKGVNLNIKCHHKRTVLVYASVNNLNSRLIKMMIENGADPNIIDASYNSAFNYAVDHKNLNLIKILLNADATFDWSLINLGKVHIDDIAIPLILNNYDFNKLRIKTSELEKTVQKDYLPTIFLFFFDFLLIDKRPKVRPIYNLKVLTIMSINRNIRHNKNVKQFKKTFPLLFEVYPGNTYRYSKNKKRKKI